MLVELAKRYVNGNPLWQLMNPRANWAIDTSMIRFYHLKGLLKKPKKEGRESIYTIHHLKQIIALKLLQVNGVMLKSIKKNKVFKHNPDEIIRRCGEKYGITPEQVESFVPMAMDAIENDVMRIMPQVKETANALDDYATPEEMGLVTGQPLMEENTEMATKQESPLSVTINDGNKYGQIRSKMRLGSSFAFFSELEDEAAKAVYRLLYGQKTKGKTPTAAIYVDHEGVDLPGCSIVAPKPDDDMGVVVADKDVYREGEDVAQIYVFNPAKKSKQVELTVSLDGAPLDKLVVKLDANGCGMTRYATIASGRYSVAMVDSQAQCSFDAAKYALAPLTASLLSLDKAKNNILTAVIAANSFGEPFEGKTRIVLTCDGQETAIYDAKFEDGKTSLSFDAKKADGNLALRVASVEDPDLIANVPLPGSRKEQREETVVSQLGKVRTVSLIRSEGSEDEKGLFFSEGAIRNTPVSIDNCISGEIALHCLSDMTHVTVAVRNPMDGSVNIEELGSLRAGDTQTLDYDSAIAAVHVGGFVNGKPWEGSAVLVKPSDPESISIEASWANDGEWIKPGETLNLKIRTKNKSSVLVRVADKRMRVQEDARTSIASMLKRWIGRAVGECFAGEVKCLAPVIQLYDDDTLVRGLRGLRGMGGMEMLRARLDWDGGKVGLANVGYLAKGTNADLTARADENPMVMYAATNLSGEVKTANAVLFNQPAFYNPLHSPNNWGISGYSGIKGTEGMKGSLGVLNDTAKEQGTAIAREMEVDLVYCGLLEVDGEKEIAVKMPDCIGHYDITAFAVSGNDWLEAKTSVVMEKESYFEPMIPQFAHPDDGILCSAVVVRKRGNYVVSVDGKYLTKDEVKVEKMGRNVRLTWPAVPGVHELYMYDEYAEGEDGNIDKVVRVVECPGEETVLGQELRILKAGDRFDLSDDEDALSVKVLPGMQSELKVAVSVCTDFEHYCCEQSSAMVTAACVAAMIGDESGKEKAYQAIIAGEARLRKMFVSGKGFNSYPGRDMVEEWSATAARRTSGLGACISKDAVMPADVRKAVESMVEMGKDAMKAHGKMALQVEGEMESIYYGRNTRKITKDDIEKVLNNLSGKMDAWSDYSKKSEGAFCAAALLMANQIDKGIDVANAVAKAMAGTLGGAMHGSYEALAYMSMVNELQKANVVPASGSGKVRINGEKEVPVTDAIDASDVSSVEAVGSACAIRVTKLSRIKFDDVKTGVGIEVDVKGKHGAKTFKPGMPVKMKVSISDGYQMGDVLCVALPDCLSRIIGGTKAKKFQIDFGGKSEIEVDLVAGRATMKPQRWAAVVRNMYDGARIGSVGLLMADVGK
jgi:DNA-binding transcriptional MerR regulator